MANINIKTQKILSPENIKRIISLGISLKDSISALENKCIEDYDTTKTYAKNTLVIYNGYIYKTKTVTTGDFDENKFEKIGDHLDLLTLDDIKAMINLGDEDIKTLQSLILDTSIELSHVWSSSKTYGEIQNAIKKGEAFTLSKLASTMTASFEIATSTSDITEGNILYLLNTGTNTYDIYALIGGTPTVIASTTIDLSQFYTKTEIDNDFVKKTDADGKYALITTVDKKAEKTDLDNHINDTVSHMTQSEKDSYALKSSITDTIDSTSTSTDIASAKGVFDELDKKIDKTDILTAVSASPSDSNLLSEKAIKSELDKKSNKTDLDNFKQGILVTETSMNKNILLWDVGHYYFNGNDIWKKYEHIPNTEYAPHVYVTSVKPVKYENTNNKGTWFRQIKVDDHLGKSFIRTIYTANVKNVVDLENGKLLSGDQRSDTGWQRVCTTSSVADVPLTKITFSDTTYYEVYNPAITYYEVVNGICYLQADVKVKNKFLSYNKVLDGIPIPKLQQNGMASPWNSNNTNANLLFEIRNGSLFLAYGEASQHHIINIAYPVA